MKTPYEMVIGVEIHAELKTATKIFCGCSTAFGAEPNTQCCPVCTGMPGALPVLNREVVHLAAVAGLATHCRISRHSVQDRKNYFYPDLPKAYQISQYDRPLCEGGWLDIETEQGQKRIGITRIHIEEDAGKLLHRPDGTRVDCNRCGVPLIEIVSEPDLRSGDEVKAFLGKLRAVLLYTGVSDCKMNEGSLRCDVNLSVRPRGEQKLGTRTEMKNLNSFQFIGRAIEYEFARQVAAIEAGEAVVQETRRFDEKSGKTFSMRRKENADDYRYFPDPDLPPIEIGDEELELWKSQIPVLPDERKARYVERFGLSPYVAEQLTVSRAQADYFEETAALTKAPRAVAGLLLTEVPRLLPPDSEEIPVAPARMAVLGDMLLDGSLSSGAGKALLGRLWECDADPRRLAQEMGLLQVSDEQTLWPLVQKVVGENPKAAADWRGGKQAAMQALIGRCMKETRGRGNPAVLQELLKKALEQ